MRWKKVRMSQELIIDVLRQYSDKFPEEMMIWAAAVNKTGTVDLYVYSEEFKNLPEGQPAELLDITFDEFSSMK